jgi:alkylation response protein AidB-like acyl-CoA dehydrogenase
VLDFALGPALEALRERARAVAAEGVAEFGLHHDSWVNGFSRPFARRLADEGWIGLGWPVEHGGGGRPAIERVVIAEEMISAGAPIAAMWVADRQMGPSIIAYGTTDQQAEYLPGMLSGEATWCIGMSEPDAGSDLASLATTAVRQGDRYVVNGQKIWTSSAAIADYCYLICRTSHDGPPHRGISELIVPMDSPGIEVRQIRDLTTNRHFCEGRTSCTTSWANACSVCLAKPADPPGELPAGTSRPGFGRRSGGYRTTMFILGVILIILGVVLSIPILYTIGVILAVIGLILWVLGAMGREIGGRSHYY